MRGGSLQAAGSSPRRRSRGRRCSRRADSSGCASSCSRMRRRWRLRGGPRSVLPELERALSKKLPAVAEELVTPAFPRAGEWVVDQYVPRPGAHESDGVFVEVDSDLVSRRRQPTQVRPGGEPDPGEDRVAGEKGRSHRPDAPAVQVGEMEAVPGRETADRWLVHAEPSFRPASGRAPDEATLRIPPAEEAAAGNRLRIERAAAW